MSDSQLKPDFSLGDEPLTDYWKRKLELRLRLCHVLDQHRYRLSAAAVPTYAGFGPSPLPALLPDFLLRQRLAEIIGNLQVPPSLFDHGLQHSNQRIR